MTMMNSVDEIKSPCISVCALNDDGVCIGCWRDVEEIAGWREFSNPQKQEVLKKAVARARESGNWL